MRLNSGKDKRQGGFLTRLARDERGNVIAIMAIALLPISAFAGSAVDMARLYVVKARLQQACDAGALAGRKFMIDDADNSLDTNARNQANTFFNNNFKDGWLGTKQTTKTFDESGTNQVVGTARTVVPMTIMKMFSQGDRPIEVNCAARLDVPDVDVMLVLDTTGSMACPPTGPSSCGGTPAPYERSDGTTGYAISEASGSRMAGLRTAVLDFYDTMTANVDAATHVRYGFVPYSSTINVGSQLPANFLVSDTWQYQTRRIQDDANWEDPFDTEYKNTTLVACDAKVGRTPAAAKTFDTSGNAIRTTKKSWVAPDGGTCVITTQKLVPLWRFEQAGADVSQFVKSIGAGAKVQDPSKYTTSLNRWQGCIEERDTEALTSFDGDDLPADLDPDLPPTNNATRWRPMWPEQYYNRRGTDDYGLRDVPDNYFPLKRNSKDIYRLWPNHGGDEDYLRLGYVSCGAAAQRLQEMDRSEVAAYIARPEFRPQGGTYHDLGMIWGTRFISPTGPFRNDTLAWPGRGEPNRHIIFMTDGDMKPETFVYGSYGVESYDKRVTGGDLGSLKDRHNARFLAVCEAARRRNITVWVIGFGQALTSELNACAAQPASQHAFFADSDDKLKEAFRRIAKQVASLRVYK